MSDEQAVQRAAKLRILDAANIPHELAVEASGERLVTLSIGEEAYTAEPWEIDFALAGATGRLPRPPWPSQTPGADETAPFDVVCLAQRRSETVALEKDASVSRMSQQQRANRALERGAPVFDLLVTVKVPNLGGAQAQITGVPGSEVTVSALYWTAHVLRGMSENAARASAQSANGG